jgi:hypothetical protein
LGQKLFTPFGGQKSLTFFFFSFDKFLDKGLHIKDV